MIRSAGRSGALQGDTGRRSVAAFRGRGEGRSGAVRGDPGRSGAIQSPHGPQKFNPKSSRTAKIQSKVLTDRKNPIQKSSRTAKNQSRRYCFVTSEGPRAATEL